MEKANNKIGGDWQLMGTSGQTVTSADLEGSSYLIYFGFTKCPDICPATLFRLSKIARIIRASPENKYFSLKTVFVSVDPERDTPEVLKKYLKNFDKSIIGVTGKSL